jgi:hypothetical protein
LITIVGAISGSYQIGLNEQGDGVTSLLALNSAESSVVSALNAAATLVKFSCTNFGVKISKLNGNMFIYVTYNIDNIDPMPLLSFNLDYLIGTLLSILLLLLSIINYYYYYYYYYYLFNFNIDNF